jgi:iron complex transport system substrate-binding protein
MLIKNNLFRILTRLFSVFKWYHIKLLIFSIVTSLILIGCGASTPQNIALNPQSITSQTRVVKHAMGETKVPLHPKRVVVMGALDNALALGIKPIGATTLSDNNFLNHLDDLTVGIEKVGINGQPNLEKILYLKPDLILGLHWDAELYEKLSQIAPTVLAGEDTNWKQWLTKFAEALGQTQKAEKLLREYEQKVQKLHEIYAKSFSQPKVSLVSFWANYTRLYMNSSFSGSILKEIGISRPSYQDKDKANENISLELIPQIEGDVIFLILGGHNPSKLKQFTNHPLWSRLQAVKQKHVYPVTSDTWISAWGIIGANLVLDDLLKYLPL